MDNKRVKQTVTAVFGSLSVVAVMIGLPGMLDDLSAWREFIARQRLGDWPWWMWMGFAVLFFGAALAPWIGPSLIRRVGAAWNRYRHRPSKTSSGAERPGDSQTEAERRLIQDIRQVWNRYGQHAAAALHGSFAELVYCLKEQRYWGVLLIPKVEALKTANNALSEVVDYQSTASLEDVRSKFNAMYEAYIWAMFWIAKIHGAKEAVLLDQEAFERRFEHWKVQQCLFAEQLADLNEIPEHNRTLLIQPNVHMQFDGDFSALLRDIQELHLKRVDKLLGKGSATPSTSDTESHLLPPDAAEGPET